MNAKNQKRLYVNIYLFVLFALNAIGILYSSHYFVLIKPMWSFFAFSLLAFFSSAKLAFMAYKYKSFRIGAISLFLLSIFFSCVVLSYPESFVDNYFKEMLLAFLLAFYIPYLSPINFIMPVLAYFITFLLLVQKISKAEICFIEIVFGFLSCYFLAMVAYT